MKKITVICAMVICAILLTACNGKEPEIDIHANVSSISKEEYKKVGATEELSNPKQEDFKIFEFAFNMKHANSLEERSIEMDNFNNLRKVLDKADGTSRYWYGSGTENDNKGADTVIYKQEFVFYEKGLSEEEFKQAFSDEKIIVSWINEKNEEVRKEYTLSDLITFDAK